jgi:hypothetical protein
MTSKEMSRAALLAAVVLFAGCNEIAGIRAGDPLGSPIDCEKESDCPAPGERECSSLVGCKSGTCAYANELDGKVIEAQVDGDCTQRVCDGKGRVRLQSYDDDAADDGKPCTLDTCEGGLPKHTPLQEVPCYDGPEGTENVGLCKGGIQHCDADFQPIGGCEGQILPQPESCLTPEDENCNGATNEGGESCICTPDAVSTCYDGPQGTSGVGVCQVGTCLCNHAGTACASACTGQVLPGAKEDCSTPTDDDCDGQTVDLEDGCVCAANQPTACYTGPMGTEGVGLCKSGTQTCDAMGKGYTGPCSDVVPNPADDCTIVGDDDCNGKSVDSCTGAVEWVKASTSSGSYNYNSAWSIATDATGDLYAAGIVYGSAAIDFGGGPLTPPYSATGYAAFVVKLAPDGTHLWSKLLPCASSDASSAPHLAVAAGQVALAYRVGGYSCDFGSGTAASTYGAALIRLDASTGAFVSNAVIGGSNTYLYALGASSSGVYLAGYQNGDGTIGSVSLSYEPFVAKVDGSNTVLWAKGFALGNLYSGGTSNRVTALAVRPDGTVAFAGNAYEATIDLGTGPAGDASAYENHYFGVLESDGSPRWGQVFNKASSCCSAYAPTAMGFAPNGDVVAAGSTYGGLQIGAVSIGSHHGYVGRLAAADGTVSWAEDLILAGNSNNELYSMSIDVLGHIGIAALGSSYKSELTSLDGAGLQLGKKTLPMIQSYGIPLLVAPAKDAGLLFTGMIQPQQTFDGTTVGSPNSNEFVFGKLVP